MIALLFHPSPQQEDYVTAELWELGTEGIIEEADGIRAFFHQRLDPAPLLAQFADCSPELRHEALTDWSQVSRDAWPALEIGKRFFLVAPWPTDSTPAVRLRLVIYPVLACRTGRHQCPHCSLLALDTPLPPSA